MAAERDAMFDAFGFVLMLSILFTDYFRYVLLMCVIVYVLSKLYDHFSGEPDRDVTGWSNKKYIREQIEKHKSKQ